MLFWLIFCPLTLAALFGVFLVIFFHLPKFGALPTGARLERILNSPHYLDGKFQNIHPLPGEIVDNKNRSFLDFFFRKGRLVPAEPLPTVKSNLKALNDNELVWFGHSSFLVKLSGHHFLIDPVFSDHASPLWFLTKAFPGTNVYSPEDLPKIDYLLISHDHWDHLDYPTVMQLKPSLGKIVCGLGIGAHFERWGFPAESLLEGEWGDSFQPEPGVKITIVYARHFSGRGYKWNQTMWAGFVIESGDKKIFYSGDGGYESHFLEIGQKFGGFDLAILEDGQYDQAWRYIHMTPEETVQAGLDLNAKYIIPAHNSKFSICYHDWDDPLIRVKKASLEHGVNLLTPKIGEVVNLNEPGDNFGEWWKGLK
ncbi:MAG: MBL fold metallo-hydrolase [Deltaproteobacteria bacterium]|nr:MBL fold metallo-hydrolase [Deltaproteobacteria bacterium]